MSVYIQCQICGIYRCEIDKLIKIMSNSGGDREALLKLFTDTFDNGMPPIECSACDELILDVAGAE